MQCIAESLKNGARTGATHRQYRIHIIVSSPPETHKRSISWRYRQNPKSRLYIELGHVNRRRGRLNNCNCVLNRRVCYRWKLARNSIINWCTLWVWQMVNNPKFPRHLLRDNTKWWYPIVWYRRNNLIWPDNSTQCQFFADLSINDMW